MHCMKVQTSTIYSVTNNDSTFHIASKLRKFMEIPTKAWLWNSLPYLQPGTLLQLIITAVMRYLFTLCTVHICGVFLSRHMISEWNSQRVEWFYLHLYMRNIEKLPNNLNCQTKVYLIFSRHCFFTEFYQQGDEDQKTGMIVLIQWIPFLSNSWYKFFDITINVLCF